MEKAWYQNAYRRNCIDMHITQDDDSFMSKFDAQTYVEMLMRSQSQSAVVYAHSHVGYCYFPSKVGPMHKGLNGRDIFSEVVDLCHENGIAVVAYLSLIFDTWVYRNHPDWRILGVDGRGVADKSRRGVCCPNSPYRDYAASIAREICENYDTEGIRFDMTFWPAVCYCAYCRARFAKEVGGELPKVINWEDTHWVAFARKREEWLVDFAALQTGTVKKVNPHITVEHQTATYSHYWRFGVTTKLAQQNDFLQGDFYGGALQGSFVRKLFYNLSHNRPGGFETCIAVDLGNYTALESTELLRARAYAALADAAAFLFIDTIDPVGTLNPLVYERMGRVFEETKPYESHVGGELCQDVAVYLSTMSKGDFADNGKAVDDPHLSTKAPHVDAAVSVCRSLIDHHIPFGVITRENLDELSRHQIVVLPNVLMMDDDEVTAFRAYVQAGGCLYASRYTSLITTDGRRQEDLLLADVFGVSYQGETKERFTYIAPAEGEETIFGTYTYKHPPGWHATQVIVNAKPDARVLGTLVLPYTDPADPTRFSSIHNNPPGIYTDHPAIVLNHFGKGKAIYVAGDLENADPHRGIFINLIRLLVESFSFEADAPKPVEVTLFHQEDKRRFIVNLVNFQKELPNIPVEGISVRVRLDGKQPKQLVKLPDGEALDYETDDGYLEYVAPRLDTFAMFALDYQ